MTPTPEPAVWKAIVAMSANRVIGNKGAIPWHCADDLKFFKDTTLGHTVVMGYNTFRSLGQKPLKGRRNIVMSREADDYMGIYGYEMVDSIEALDALNLTGTVFVIGGHQVYKQLLPRCTEVIATIIDGEFEGDTFFPELPERFVELSYMKCPGGYAHQHFMDLQENESGPTPSRYQWTYEGVTFDFYRLCEILGITSHPQAHALKKVIRAGRSVKPLERDIKEAADALTRWRQMVMEDEAK